MLVVVPRYGPMGAAGLWLVLNIVYVLLEMPFMHRRLLRGEALRWYVFDIGMPLGITLLIGGVAHLFAPIHAAWPWQLAWSVLVCGACGAANLAAMPRLWRSLLQRKQSPRLQTA